MIAVPKIDAFRHVQGKNVFKLFCWQTKFGSLQEGKSWNSNFAILVESTFLIYIRRVYFCPRNETSWWLQPRLKTFSQNGNLPQIGVKIKDL